MNMMWLSGGSSLAQPNQTTAEAGKKVHSCDRMSLKELPLPPFLFLFSCFMRFCNAERSIYSAVLRCHKITLCTLQTNLTNTNISAVESRLFN